MSPEKKITDTKCFVTRANHTINDVDDAIKKLFGISKICP